jgi:hypothetical protein
MNQRRESFLDGLIADVEPAFCRCRSFLEDLKDVLLLVAGRSARAAGTGTGVAA